MSNRSDLGPIQVEQRPIQVFMSHLRPLQVSRPNIIRPKKWSDIGAENTNSAESRVEPMGFKKPIVAFQPIKQTPVVVKMFGVSLTDARVGSQPAHPNSYVDLDKWTVFAAAPCVSHFQRQKPRFNNHPAHDLATSTMSHNYPIMAVLIGVGLM
jgi:hypothetical protein